jgi:hypothetical protein
MLMLNTCLKHGHWCKPVAATCHLQRKGVLRMKEAGVGCGWCRSMPLLPLVLRSLLLPASWLELLLRVWHSTGFQGCQQAVGGLGLSSQSCNPFGMARRHEPLKLHVLDTREVMRLEGVGQQIGCKLDVVAGGAATCIASSSSPSQPSNNFSMKPFGENVSILLMQMHKDSLWEEPSAGMPCGGSKRRLHAMAYMTSAMNPSSLPPRMTSASEAGIMTSSLQEVGSNQPSRMV